MHARRPLELAFRSRIRQTQAIQTGTKSHASKTLFQSRQKSTASTSKSASSASSSDRPVTPAFIFDIDGVLKVGEKVLPQGKKVQ